MPGRTAARRAECEVQRRVHPHVSRQYQRRSGQALPPSATIWWAGNRIPHNQQDLTRAGSPPSGAGRCGSVMTRSPRSPAARTVVSAGAAALPTAAPVRSASRPSDASPLLIHTLPVHWVSAVPRQLPLPREQECRQGRRGGRPPRVLRVPGPAGTGVVAPLAVPACRLTRGLTISEIQSPTVLNPDHGWVNL